MKYFNKFVLFMLFVPFAISNENYKEYAGKSFKIKQKAVADREITGPDKCSRAWYSVNFGMDCKDNDGGGGFSFLEDFYNKPFSNMSEQEIYFLRINLKKECNFLFNYDHESLEMEKCIDEGVKQLIQEKNIHVAHQT